MENQDAATQRYKALEADIQRLEISQRKREQQRGRRKLGKPDFSLNRKILPAIRPSTVPGRSAKGTVHRATIEVNQRRNTEDKHDARVQELLQEKLNLNMSHSAATSQEYRLQKSIRDKKSRLAVLVDQDNINQRRSEMMMRCNKEQKHLADKNMSIAILTNYTHTLNLMKDRLWINQTTFQKTLAAYYDTLRAAKAEVTDVTKMKENAALRLAKAHEYSKKFKQRATEVLQTAQKQLDGMRYVTHQQEEFEDKARQKAEARREGQLRKANESRAKDITLQLRAATNRKKQAIMMEKLGDHEDAFRKIQMASGLETDAEIIDAFNNREAYLSDVVRKVETLRRQLNEAQKHHNNMKASLVNELVENDASAADPVDVSGGAASLVMNLWGGRSDSHTNVDISTDLLQQKRQELQHVMREQSKARGLIIKFAQAVEGVFSSVAAMQNAKLGIDELIVASNESPSSSPDRPSSGISISSIRSGGRSTSRPSSSRLVSHRSSRGYNLRSGTPGRRERARDRDRDREPAVAVPPPPGGSILTSSHLSHRMEAISKTATELITQITNLPAAKNVSGDSAGVGEEKEANSNVEPSDTREGPQDDTNLRVPGYEERISEFMWEQKFSVRNNIRVKSVIPAVHKPDDRQSFFLQENKAKRDRAQMEDMLDGGQGGDGILDLDHENDMLFDRNSMKKSSQTLINKNTRRQKRSKKKGNNGSSNGSSTRTSPMRVNAPSPRRGIKSIRSSAPGEN